MPYYSLTHPAHLASFEEATLRGQAPDRGLYFPVKIPVLPPGFMQEIQARSKEEIALTVIQPYVEESIPVHELKKIIAAAIPFDFPLIKLTDRIFSLELFHGPTLAFKDVGARFMSRCLGYFLRNNHRNTRVLVATSGDTGGAVADGFLDVDGIEVIILYPSGKVSRVQESQLTTSGNNISALEINGTFDDCQRLVKQAFVDVELNKLIQLTSANSINVARWLPQQFYYFFAIQQWPDTQRNPVFSVPSGNFGNICAGLLALRSGLPAKHFIAACNSNHSVTSFLETGQYLPKPALQTISNAMDVGDPSNFVRLLGLFNDRLDRLKKELTSFSITDEETKDSIRNLYAEQGYLMDPHGAVGYLSLKRYLAQHQDQKGIFLETAHPVKFYDVVEPLIGEKIPLPPQILFSLGKKKQAIKMNANYSELRDYLLNT
jgi:threonine synthase